MSSTTTRIANLDHVVAWDDSEQRHVYLDGADLVFKDNEVVHVGPGYTGTADATINKSPASDDIGCPIACMCLTVPSGYTTR